MKFRLMALAFLALVSCSRHEGHVLMQEIDLGSDKGTLNVFWNYRERSCSWLECGESSTKITYEEFEFRIGKSNLESNKVGIFACTKKYPCKLETLKIAICDDGVLFSSYFDEFLNTKACHGDFKVIDFSKNYGEPTKSD